MMPAWIACVMSAALLGDGPNLNQPQPHIARPAPNGVGLVAELPVSAFIPPAPLPEFDEVESPEIQFEFSQPKTTPPANPVRPGFTLKFEKRFRAARQSPARASQVPEACSDSHVCPP